MRNRTVSFASTLRVQNTYSIYKYIYICMSHIHTTKYEDICLKLNEIVEVIPATMNQFSDFVPVLGI